MENHRKHNIFCHLYLNSNSNWYYFFYQEFSLKKPTYRMIYMYKREKLNYYHSIFKIYFMPHFYFMPHVTSFRNWWFSHSFLRHSFEEIYINKIFIRGQGKLILHIKFSKSLFYSWANLIYAYLNFAKSILILFASHFFVWFAR